MDLGLYKGVTNSIALQNNLQTNYQVNVSVSMA